VLLNYSSPFDLFPSHATAGVGSNAQVSVPPLTIALELLSIPLIAGARPLLVISPESLG
jgi:hypothetical protein